MENLYQNRENSNWVNIRRFVFTHNRQGDISEVLIEQWHNNNWVLFQGIRMNYSYSNNLPTEAVVEVAGQSGTWYYVEKKIIAYNSNSEPSEIITQDYTSSGWVNKTKLTNIQWHYWTGSEKDYYNYAETQIWSGGNWHNYLSETNTFANGNLPVNSLTQKWVAGNYVDSLRHTWKYDQWENQTLFIAEHYNHTNSKWIINSGDSNVYTMNSNGCVETNLLNKFNTVSNFWYKEEKLLFEYDNTVSIFKAISQSNIKIYPNPTSDYLNLQLNAKNFTVTITDLTGRNVLHAQNDKNIDVSNLKSGVYMLHINSEKGNAVVKFVKN